jgi:hypothetical protein
MAETGTRGLEPAGVRAATPGRRRRKTILSMMAEELVCYWPPGSTRRRSPRGRRWRARRSRAAIPEPRWSRPRQAEHPAFQRERSWKRGTRLLERSRQRSTALMGSGLVVLADRVPARRARLLHDAETLLHDRALADASDPYQRSALRHGAWLSGDRIPARSDHIQRRRDTAVISQPAVGRSFRSRLRLGVDHIRAERAARKRRPGVRRLRPGRRMP